MLKAWHCLCGRRDVAPWWKTVQHPGCKVPQRRITPEEARVMNRIIAEDHPPQELRPRADRATPES